MPAPSEAVLVRAYNLFRRMSRWPELLPQMRALFQEVLEERGIRSRQSVEEEARRRIREDGVPDTEESFREYCDAIVDLAFAGALSADEAENYVNLVRKRDRCLELGRVVNSGTSTPRQVYEALKDFCDIPKGEIYISREEAEGIRVALLSRYVSASLPFVGIAKNHVTIRDLYAVLSNTIGHLEYPGRLGGKAAGMILAQKILLPILKQRDPLFDRYVTVPDTWYISSGVFSDFLDRNRLHSFHTHKYGDREAIEKGFRGLEARLESAAFPPEIVEAFRGLMEEIGEHPIIVRSSSYLEDSFGLAFSGKYESVFLANQGEPEKRLSGFLRGVKRVLASTYGPDPILYRRDHDLLDYNERMAMIVQKVVGRRFGDWFFPLASGVLFSYNSYGWSPRIRKEDGLVRMVFGLGTRAVDRVGSGYPRMIPLSNPGLRPEVDEIQILRYSQKKVDAINLRKESFETVDFQTVAAETRHPDLFDAVSLMQDGQIAAPLFRIQDLSAAPTCLTFENLISRPPFVPLVKRVLEAVRAAYGRHVDIEFAWDGGMLYVLQCRSLSTRPETEHVAIPKDLPPECVLFRTLTGLSNAVLHDLEYVVYVDPREYDRLESYEAKVRVGRTVNRVNQALAGRAFALMGPGRWGSNDINLGVQVTYADINNTSLLVEIAFSREGFTPEVSYGTHFFQDLVEADIAIMPLYPDGKGSVLREDLLLRAENRLSAVSPDSAEDASVVRVIHVPSAAGGRYLHVFLDGESQEGVGVFAKGSGSSGGE